MRVDLRLGSLRHFVAHASRCFGNSMFTQGEFRLPPSLPHCVLVTRHIHIWGGAHLQWINTWCTPSPHFTFNFDDSALLAASYWQPLVWRMDGTHISSLLLSLDFHYFSTTIFFGTPVAWNFAIRRLLKLVCFVRRISRRFSPLCNCGQGVSNMQANLHYACACLQIDGFDKQLDRMLLDMSCLER